MVMLSEMSQLDLRAKELDTVCAALRRGKSILVLGEAGSGKSTLADQIQITMSSEGYEVAIASYLGSAKTTLQEVADQLQISVVVELENGKEKSMTLEEMRIEVLKNLTSGKRILIVDDAQRFPASLKYWLEVVLKGQGRLVLLADRPPASGIFLKVPRIEMEVLDTYVIRNFMMQEAQDHNVNLSASEIAELEQRCGGNPALAKRVVHEFVLGLSETNSTDHRRYVDGTPFLISALSIIGVVRFIGLGIGDRSLYIIGGIAMILSISIRTIFTELNKKGGKL
jgi:ABC-type oligopeptide transport system ATPase subunit